MLDVPNFFWESEPTLHPLYNGVREYLEIKPRIQVLNERCKVFLDLAEMLSDSISDNKSSRKFFVFFCFPHLSHFLQLLLLFWVNYDAWNARRRGEKRTNFFWIQLIGEITRSNLDYHRPYSFIDIGYLLRSIHSFWNALDAWFETQQSSSSAMRHAFIVLLGGW